MNCDKTIAIFKKSIQTTTAAICQKFWHLTASLKRKSSIKRNHQKAALISSNTPIIKIIFLPPPPLPQTQQQIMFDLTS